MKTEMNPWAGLASYQDPAAGSTLLFCGRDNESYDLAALADDNIFCTLYGKSGTGKTSLLNAGMFPRLRAMGYLPLSIRLGMEAMGTTFQQCIATRLGKVAVLETVDTVPLPVDDQDEQWLWAWFARTRFVDAEGKTRFPVLVFDQFEEVFRSRRAEAETLLRQIHFMMDPSHSLGDDYDYNFRFLASIREDDLYLLEDSLDRHFMGDMKQCRYRLNSLTDEGAREVILKPGEGLFSTGEQDAIVDTVIGIARSADGSINTNILSLVCSRIYDHYKRSGDSNISLDLVRRFVSSNPFEQFYNEVTADLSEREKQFIEDRLVDAAGRRGSVSEPDFEKNVPNGAHLLEGTGRILQRVASGTEGRSYRIELIHDSFCAPLADQKLKRAARRRRRVIAALSAVALVVVAIAAYIVVVSIRNARQTREILIQQEKFYAKQASQLLDEGDTYTAFLLLNELTDPDGPFAKVPLQPEAERQMRRAVQLHDETEWQVAWSVRNIGNIAYTPQMTPDGKYLVVSVVGGIKIFNCSNGKMEGWINVDGIGTISRPVFAISHDGRKIIVDENYDGYIGYQLKLYNLPLGEPCGASNHLYLEGGYNLAFSHDDKFVIFTSYKEVENEVERIITPDCLTGVDIDSFAQYIRYESNAIYDVQVPKRGGEIITSMELLYDSYGEDSVRNVVVADECTGKEIATIDFRDCLSYKRDDKFWKCPNYTCINNNELLVQKKDGIYVHKIAEKKWELLLKGTFDMRICAEKRFGISEDLFMVSNKDSLFLYHLKDGSLSSKLRVDTAYFDYASLNYDDNSVVLVNRGKGNVCILKHTCSDMDSAKQELIDKTIYASFYGWDSVLIERDYDYYDSISLKYRTYSLEGLLLSEDNVGRYDSIQSRHLSPNGRYVLLYNYKCEDVYYIYDRWRKERKPTFIASFNSAWFSFDDVSVYFLKYDQYDTTLDHNVLRKFNIETGDTIDCAETPPQCDFLDWNANSKCLLLECHPSPPNMAVYNTENNKIIAKKEIKYKDIKFTPDGKHLVATRTDRSVLLYNALTLDVVDSCIKGFSSILGFSPDSKYVLLDVDNRMELWSLSPLRPVWIIENETYSELKKADARWSPSLTFSKDGKSIIFYSEKTYKDGRLHFTRIPVLSQEELKARVQELASGRKLTDEEKNLLME